MNKKYFEFLNYVLRYSRDGELVVFDSSDLKTNTGKFPLTDDELGALIEHLTLNEMIKVSYSDDKSYCLAILPKGKLAIDKENAKKFDGSIKFDINYKKLFFITFLGGFLGSLLCVSLTLIIRSFI